MKNKKLIIIVVAIVLVITVIVGVEVAKNRVSDNNDKNRNSNSVVSKKKTLDVPYYGDITIGDVTTSLLSSPEQLENAGFEKSIFSTYYKEPKTGDKFTYMYYDFDNSEQVEIVVYNDVPMKNGFSEYNQISNSIKLPKNITYNSTLSDVKKAYGEPENIRENETLDGLTLSKDKSDARATIVTYNYKEDDHNNINLYLYFLNETNKLYKATYQVQLSK